MVAGTAAGGIKKYASVPQFYYMGSDDENDALQFNDAYSDLEREIVKAVLDEDMDIRWEFCENIYKSYGIHAEFHKYQDVGHETTDKINEHVASFFNQIINEYE